MALSNSNIRQVEKIASIALVLLFAYLAVQYFFRNQSYSVDDSFITYRYAINLLSGNGLVFNVGERYYGTTAAGYGIFLAMISKLVFLFTDNFSVQNVAVILSAASLFSIALLVLRITFRSDLNVYLKVVSSAVFSFGIFCTVPFNEVAGHETYAFLAGALFGAVLASRGHMLAGGIVVGITSTFRPDAVLFAPIICCVYVYINRIPVAQWLKTSKLWKFAVGFFSVVLPWLAFVQVYFGRPFPGTMDSKKSQFLMGLFPIYNFQTLWQYIYDNVNYVSVCIFALGLIALLVRANVKPVVSEVSAQSEFVGICWLAFLILSVSFYLSIGVSFWHWYGIPVLFSLAVCALTGITQLGHVSFAGFSLSRILKGIFCILVIAFTVKTYPSVNYWFHSKNVNLHTSAYFEVADYLKAQEPNGAIVEMAEPGSFAVRLGEKFMVVDELGLITPNVSKEFLKGNHDYATEHYSPKYIICSWRGLYSACSKPRIMANYDLVGEYDKGFWSPKIGSGLQLYKLK
jgi:hypothetical protein